MDDDNLSSIPLQLLLDDDSFDELLKTPNQFVEDLQASPIILDGRKRTIDVPGKTKATVLMPLSEWINTRWKEISSSRRRLLIGVVGAGGTGKTILSQLLNNLIETKFGPDFCKVLSMDAYHLPNEVLCNTQWSQHPNLTLKDGKGFPETLDADAFVKDLNKIRQSKVGSEVCLPIYDRSIHEPVQDQLILQPCTEIVIVEGLHLLHQDGSWAQVKDLLHGTIALRCSEHIRRERIVTRKVQNGRSFESSSRHFDLVDQPIAMGIEDEIALADIEINLGAQPLQITSAKVRSYGSGTCVLTDECWGSQATEEINFLVFGLNPALQKKLEFSAAPLTLGAVNRASTMDCGIGGKGQNVCSALRCLEQALQTANENNKKKFRVTLAQFIGGQTGAKVKRMLDSLGVSCFPPDLQTQQATRICTTLLDTLTGETTEIVEPCGAVSEEEQAILLSSLTTEYFSSMSPGGLKGIAIMGSLPTNVGPDFYARAICELRKTNCCGSSTKLLVDSVHGLPDLLANCQIDFLKVNAAELAKLAELDIGSSNESIVGIPFEKVKESAIKFLQPNNICFLGVTDGGNSAYLFLNPFMSNPVNESDDQAEDQGISLPFQYWRYTLPSLGNCVSGANQHKIYPIGAGDTVSAITLSYWASGCGIVRSFHKGLAAASSSCLCPFNANFSLDDMERISREIKVEKVVELYPQPVGL